jgi:phytoene/squalene synthetase
MTDVTPEDLTACAGLVERGDPDRFLAAMAAPPGARDVLFPLYAFNVEVSRAPWVTQEPTIAEMRLQWWRDALDEIAQGGTPRRHEVVTPLASLLDDPACAVLDRLVLARRWDIYRDPFEDAAAFDSFLDDTAGGLMWVAGRALGAPAGAEPALRNLGYAQGLAAWFRAIPALEAAGRVPLVDGRAEAVAALAEAGLARLEKGRKGQGALPRRARAAVLPAWQAAPVLRTVARDPRRVADGLTELSPGGAKLRLILAAARGRI